MLETLLNRTTNPSLSFDDELRSVAAPRTVAQTTGSTAVINDQHAEWVRIGLLLALSPSIVAVIAILVLGVF